MAIVINGSGTITGISAGGLPDGSVTADDLASTLDLSGKTVTLAAGGTGYGKVLQVVSTAYSTETAFTSTSFVATSVSVSITPSSASSKILLLSTVPIQAGSSGIVTYTIYRGATNLGDATYGFGRWFVASADTTASMVYLDSPATTNATTYAVYVKTSASTAYYSIGNTPSSIVAMEIAA